MLAQLEDPVSAWSAVVGKNVGLYVGLGIAALVLILMVTTYNGMASAQADVEAQKGQIGIVYARKVELLPEMERLAGDAMRNETAFVQEVAALRSGCAQVATEAGDAQVDCSQKFKEAGDLMIAIINERYPELRSLALVENVQVELVNSVNKVAQEQRLYNAEATAYNKRLVRFPGNLVAGAFGFEKAPIIGTQTADGINPA